MRPWTNALWLGAMALLALAAWAFLPRPAEGPPSAPRLTVALVDASASAARARDWLPWVRAELRALAERARSAHEELAVAVFGAGLATSFAPGDPARFLAELAGDGSAPLDPRALVADGETRLAAALEGIEPWLLARERPPGELVLLAPCTFTGRSPAVAFARLAAAGVEVRARTPPPLAESDLGLLELALPPRVEPGTPLVALARLVQRRGTAPAGAARVALELQCGGSVRARSLEIALPSADGPFELPLDCGPAGEGTNELRARVSLDGGPDLLPENDRARAVTRAGEARSIGVAVHAETRLACEAWLSGAPGAPVPGLHFVPLEPGETGTHLADLDALVSFDLAPGELPAPLLESFVQAGGGWLAVAGWRFLAGWGPGAEGSAARLLPCEPGSGARGPREVALLVDGSGSMEGAAFETVRAAAVELASFALPDDRVSLRFFTDGLEPAHLLKERAEDGAHAREVLRELLRARAPAGPTRLLRSLRELALEARADETLLFLLSDGRDRDAEADERAARGVAAELAAARVQLVVIAAGDADLALLSALAGGAEEVRSGDSLEELEAVFRRELRGSELAEGELALHLAARAPGSLADSVASGARSAAAPAAVERYVRSRLRPGAEALWASDAGEPVLALARAGLGRTAFLATRPGADWAARHARLAQSGLEGLLRWLARGPARAPAPRARLAAGVLRIDGLGPGTPAELRVELLAAEGTRAALALFPPAGLGADVEGTRAAPLGEEEAAEPGLLVRLANGPEAGRTLALERSLPDELAWRERPVPAGWMRAEPAPRVALRARGSRPLALLAAGLGLALLFWAGLAAARGQGVRRSGR